MLINLELAQYFENCFYQSHLKYAQHYKLETHYGENILLSSGAAFYCGKDSFFSQVIGWGLQEGAGFNSEIKQIEKFYQQQGMNACHIELSPYADASIIPMLKKRGYQLSDVTTVLGLNLKSYQPQTISTDCRLIKETGIRRWADMIAEGFGVDRNQKEQFSYFAEVRKVYPFGAFIDGDLVAGGTVAIHGHYCDIGMGATLPEYRGRGLHKDLLHARLDFAKKQKGSVAVIATTPGSIADNNCQLIGFTPAYTRLKLSKTFDY